MTEHVITVEEMKLIRESLNRYGYPVEAEAIRDHYSPRQMNGDTCIGFQGENPMILGLELAATLVARDLAQTDPERDPADHEATLLDHLDYLRPMVTLLGELGCDRLLGDVVWFWSDITMETEPSREQLVQDVRAQVEAEVSRRAEALFQQGYEAGWRTANAAADPAPTGGFAK